MGDFFGSLSDCAGICHNILLHGLLVVIFLRGFLRDLKNYGAIVAALGQYIIINTPASATVAPMISNLSGTT